MEKRERGAYYTQGNPFDNPAFMEWAEKAYLPSMEILEPFAGANSLIDRLKMMGLCQFSKSYDIEPAAEGVDSRDTLSDFPQGYDVCITNPPWLAKNSATLRGLSFPLTEYDDLYKHALEKCLLNCHWVAALVPESFIRSNVFKDRLMAFVSLTQSMFSDTGHPTGLALFSPDTSNDVNIWIGDERVGPLSMLAKSIPTVQKEHIRVQFNQPSGNVGLIALDNTYEPSIRFCEVSELNNYDVKPTGRHITKLQVDGDILIKEWNDYLNSFRGKTRDVFLTCYKGIRKDGFYRRRLDWKTTRGIVNNVI